ncbi:unnamed protein product [Boreogadus saida]
MQGLKTERGEQAGRDIDRASLRSTMPASGPLQVSAALTGAPAGGPYRSVQPSLGPRLGAPTAHCQCLLFDISHRLNLILVPS